MHDLFDGLDPPTPVERLPAQRHSPTSVAAAERAEPAAAATQRRAVLDFLRGRGADGATDEEIQVALSLNPSGERPRRIELVRGGFVRDSGTTRPTRSGCKAVVWTASTEGA